MVRSKVKEGSDKMDKTTKYMMISMVSNLFLSVLKIVFGFISNMKSLIADGIHSFSDLITDMVAIFGNRLSKKPADDGHPRGHGKIEYITSLIISCFILVLGLSILKNSFSKTDTIPNPYLIIVVIITIVTKYFLSYILIRKGKEINNMILISSGKESYTDVYSSILVLVVIILSQFYDKINVLKYSDMIGSILISVLIGPEMIISPFCCILPPLVAFTNHALIQIVITFVSSVVSCWCILRIIEQTRVVTLLYIVMKQNRLDSVAIERLE